MHIINYAIIFRFIFLVCFGVCLPSHHIRCLYSVDFTLMSQVYALHTECISLLFSSLLLLLSRLKPLKNYFVSPICG